MLKTVGNPSTRYGDQTITDGNLVIGTAGKGIDFSATANSSGTMTSELLNDYEEGTFTPNLLFGGGDTDMTYSARVGRYTKIGRMVYFTIVIYLSSKGTSSGNTTISGLPFTSGASSTFYEVTMHSDNLNTGLTLVPQIGANTTTINVYVNNSGNQANITETTFADTTRLFAVGFYEA